MQTTAIRAMETVNWIKTIIFWLTLLLKATGLTLTMSIALNRERRRDGNKPATNPIRNITTTLRNKNPPLNISKKSIKKDPN